MKIMIRAAFTLLALTLCAPVGAAGPTGLAITAPAGSVTSQAITFDDGTGKAQVVRSANPLPVVAPNRNELYPVVISNTAQAPRTLLYGGWYMLSQTCSAYGTLQLRQLGPDGITMINALAAKTASDSAGGTEFKSLPGGVVDIVLTGTTGCNATIGRLSQ